MPKENSSRRIRTAKRKKRVTPSGPRAADLLHRNLSTAVIAFHEAVARKAGLSISEHKCLGALSALGTATAGQLSRDTGFTTGAITGIVDRLERAGHVRRKPNPRDRRSVLIVLLRDKIRRKRAQALFRGLSRAVARLRRGCRNSELVTIDGYLAGVTDILKREARKLGASR